MAVRDFVLNNLRWKLTAFLLALLVWSAIKFAIYKDIRERNQTVYHVPVMVLKTPDDNRLVRVQPATVDVVIQAAKEMHPDDLEVFVDVSSIPPGATSGFRTVVVRGDEVSKLMDVLPQKVVRIELVTPSDSAITNSSKQP